MKPFLVFAWAVILFIFTCTYRLDYLIYDQIIHFTWNGSPNFADLLKIDDIHLTSLLWLLSKSGHFIGFAVLEGLLYWWLRKAKCSILIAITFAVLTEILQLYFWRDGRFVDMAIDSAGILLSYYLIAQK